MTGIARVSGGLLEPPRRLPAVQHRQAEVHQHQVRPLAPRGLDPLRAVRGDDHLEAVPPEPPDEHVDVVLVVLDVENRWHRAASLTLLASAR